jgi:hypothetical protein
MDSLWAWWFVVGRTFVDCGRSATSTTTTTTMGFHAGSTTMTSFSDDNDDHSGKYSSASLFRVSFLLFT